MVTMLMGLASRSSSIELPEFLASYLGDTLWALLVYLGIRFLSPDAAKLHSALIALSFCLCIEFSQLYHAPWIDSIRATRLGGLVLGFGFLPSDLLCYSVGVALGFMVDSKVTSKGDYTS